MPGQTFIRLLIILSLLAVTSDCRGGGGNRGSGGSRSSSPPRPSTSSYPRSSSSSYPRTPSHPSAPQTTNYGWKTPTSKPAVPQGVENAWKTRPQSAPSNVPTAPKIPAGWQARPSSTKTNQIPDNQGSHIPTNNHAQPKVSNNIPTKTSTGSHFPATSNNRHVNQPASSSNHHVNQPARSAPVNQYNTGMSGKKYEKGYSKGYDTGYQRGVQAQAMKVNPAYYPQQSSFGYPGQGINYGYHSPTYQGMGMFGSNNNYGYPVSSSYGYSSYGTGNHDFRNGLLLGVTGGYMLNSALHPRPYSISLFPSTYHESRPWGYSGGGYGSSYDYSRREAPPTVTNNYYYFNSNSPQPETSHEGTASEPENWIHCVAFDPMSDMTYTNPNCSCTVTLDKDPLTNSSVANHNCSTIWGHRVNEKTPVSDAEVFDVKAATAQAESPEKLQEIEKAMRRMEAYKQLEKVVSMGTFTIIG